MKNNGPPKIIAARQKQQQNSIISRAGARVREQEKE